VSLPPVWTEDGLWTLLRLSPSSLPTGDIEVFPEVFYQRLQHLEPEALPATATLEQDNDPATYTIEYPSLQRVLTIRFEPDFPHRIRGWTETVGGKLFSEAKATHSERLYYWERNGTDDGFLREKLGL